MHAEAQSIREDAEDEREPPNDSASGTFGPGTHTLNVGVPSDYFKVIFDLSGVGTVPLTRTPSDDETGEVGGTSGSSQTIGDAGVAGALDCSYPSTGKLLTFCAGHDFRMVLPRLIGFGQINMKECATVDIQNVP